MPIHDWSSVYPGYFHHFHQHWICAITDHLNRGGLPPGYFALVGMNTESLFPDIQTLKRRPIEGYAAKASRVAIHNRLNNVIALLEIISPGNKSTTANVDGLVAKITHFLRSGVHILIVDLFPPTRDPQGIHKLIWSAVAEDSLEQPADKPLALLSYTAGDAMSAYVEPVAVGDMLTDMPLFLHLERFVPVSLETTYMETWNSCPEPLRLAVLGKLDE